MFGYIRTNTNNSLIGQISVLLTREKTNTNLRTYLTVYFNHSFPMSWVNFVATIGTESDPKSKKYSYYVTGEPHLFWKNKIIFSNIVGFFQIFQKLTSFLLLINSSSLKEKPKRAQARYFDRI